MIATSLPSRTIHNFQGHSLSIFPSKLGRKHYQSFLYQQAYAPQQVVTSQYACICLTLAGHVPTSTENSKYVTVLALTVIYLEFSVLVGTFARGLLAYQYRKLKVCYRQSFDGNILRVFCTSRLSIRRSPAFFLLAKQVVVVQTDSQAHMQVLCKQATIGSYRQRLQYYLQYSQNGEVFCLKYKYIVMSEQEKGSPAFISENF